MDARNRVPIGLPGEAFLFETRNKMNIRVILKFTTGKLSH